MTKKTISFTDKGQGLCALWWNLALSWQWDFNKRLEHMTAALIPPAMWDAEENILSAAQENMRRLACGSCNCWLPMPFGWMSSPVNLRREKSNHMVSNHSGITSVEKAI